MSKLDGKFHGIIVKNKDGSIAPQDQWMCFLFMLGAYREESIRIGAKPEQIAAVESMIARVRAWRSANPDKCKVPDIAAGEEIL